MPENKIKTSDDRIGPIQKRCLLYFAGQPKSRASGATDVKKVEKSNDKRRPRAIKLASADLKDPARAPTKGKKETKPE